MRRRFFLLSPASTGGKRAELLFSARAKFDLATRLRDGAGVPVAEVFSFLSGLYFRGKMAYATSFATRDETGPDIRIITSDRGLVRPDLPVTLADLKMFARVPIDAASPRYRAPLLRHASELAGEAPDADVVLLGSIATGKYVDLLLPHFPRLLFPASFVGIGDMSRGSIMLEAARAGRELSCEAVSGAVRSLAKKGR